MPAASAHLRAVPDDYEPAVEEVPDPQVECRGGNHRWPRWTDPKGANGLPAGMVTGPIGEDGSFTVTETCGAGRRDRGCGKKRWYESDADGVIGDVTYRGYKDPRDWVRFRRAQEMRKSDFRQERLRRHHRELTGAARAAAIQFEAELRAAGVDLSVLWGGAS